MNDFALSRVCKCFSVTCSILFSFLCKWWNALERVRWRGHFWLESLIVWLSILLHSRMPACVQWLNGTATLGQLNRAADCSCFWRYKYFYSWGAQAAPQDQGHLGSFPGSSTDLLYCFAPFRSSKWRPFPAISVISGVRFRFENLDHNEGFGVLG